MLHVYLYDVLHPLQLRQFDLQWCKWLRDLYVVISISLHTSRPLWSRTENCQVLVKLPLSWTVFIWIICQLSSLESHFLAAPILSGTPFYYCGCCTMVRGYQSCNSSLVLPFHTSALVYNMLILQLNIQRRILIPNS